MWELLSQVLWLVILCIVGIVASLTYIVCLLIFNRKEVFKERFVQNLNIETVQEMEDEEDLNTLTIPL